MIEIEAKFRVDDLSRIADRLANIGARLVGRYVERNLIMDATDGSLRARGCGLRVRSMKPVDDATTSATLTYKGPQLGGAMKSREEHEVEVGDAEAATTILKALGYVVALSYVKRRDRWSLDGAMIELDDVPLIGSFVEIEADSEARVLETRDRLGLGQVPVVPESYPRMLMQRCRELNRPTIDIDWPQ